MNLTDEQLNKLISDIARPVFKYMLKRINKEILENDDYKDMDENQFYNVIIACMASIDTNMLRWIENFHKIKTNRELDFQALHAAFINNVNQQLKVILK